jgi:two-component system LytT family response regulator
MDSATILSRVAQAVAKPERYNVLLVDDEDLARQNVQIMLKDDSEIDSISECTNGFEAVEFLRSTPIDIVFLDIQMPQLSGFDVLQMLEPEQIPVVVFVTAYDRYALKAFAASALDYILKPVEEERFFKALERAKALRRRQKIDDLTSRLLQFLNENPIYTQQISSDDVQTQYWEHITLNSRGRAVVVRTTDIDWIEAETYYAEIHTKQKTYLLRERMHILESRLDPAVFLRIHRSVIVNIFAIKELQHSKHSDGMVILKDGTELKFSRTYKPRLQAALNLHR